MLVTQLFCARRGSLEAITGRAMERRRYCAASTADCAQLPAGTPFVLGGAAPDTSVAAVQRPLQTRCGHRARPAYLPGFLDLKQGGTRRAEGKEQVRIDVAAGGVVTPVRIRGVSLPLERATACVTHRPRHHFSSWARAVVVPRPPRMSRDRAPAITANAYIWPPLPVPAEPLLAATRTRWAGCAACQPRVRGETDARSRLRPRRRLMPRTDSSDFARNPAAGLSSISSR
jgi:hypothetical protein